MINKEKEPLVYIIMPCYNGEKYLLEQLMSIYYQNYNNWYLIFVNDWSTDNSENILRDWISHYNLHNKVKVITKENGWVNSAVQKWLEEIKNICDIQNTDSLISYCDCDDIRTREKLNIQVKYMIDNPDCILSFHDLTLINQNWIPNQHSRMQYTYIDFSFLYIWCVGNFMVSTWMMYKSKLIDYLLPMPTWPQMYQDKWTAFVSSLLWFKMGYINSQLAYYRQGHQTSLIAIEKNTKEKEKYINRQKMYEKLQQRYPEKDITQIIRYHQDRYINWYNYWLVSIRAYIKILIKYPKIFHLLLKIFLWKLFVHWRFLR